MSSSSAVYDMALYKHWAAQAAPCMAVSKHAGLLYHALKLARKCFYRIAPHPSTNVKNVTPTHKVWYFKNSCLLSTKAFKSGEE
jgi:hypothetical protein